MFVRLSTGVVVNVGRIAMLSPCLDPESAWCCNTNNEGLPVGHMHVAISDACNFAVSMDDYHLLVDAIERTVGLM